MILRPFAVSDAPAVAAIYAHHVLHGLGTFEETPPSVEEMARRAAAVQDLGLPYLVADDGAVLGFAYAGPFRQRAAYRYAVEDSVYVAPQAVGRGVGRAMLGAVIEACQALDLRQMIAIVGDSDNAASIGLHRSLGFSQRGVVEGVGYKFGRWVDVVWMQRALNIGASAPPGADGLNLGGG